MRKEICFVTICLLISVSFAFAGQGSFKVAVMPAPPNLSATVSFSEPSGNNMLDAEETGGLVITVKNSGKGEAFDVSAEVAVDKRITGLSFEKDIPVGTVAPGETVKKEVVLRATEDISTADVKFSITLKEANGFDPDPVKIAFRTKAFEPPKLIVADVGMDDQNGNSRVEPMEMVELTARVQNAGHGDARTVSVDVETGENVFIAGDGLSHFDLGGLSAGKFKDVKFMFYTNKRILNGEKIPISIKVSEARPQFRAAKALDIVMNAPQKRTEEVLVKAVEEEKGEIQIAGGLSDDVDMKIPEGKKAGEHDIAVIIGNKNYKNTANIPDVEFADRDARIMKEYLLTTFGFRKENIIYAEDATVGKFNEIFGSERNPRGKLFNFVKKNVSDVFIYYVGHGAPDLQSQEAYFVPVDANPQYISSNGYRLQTFYENLSKLPAKKVTIVIDACFSGNYDKGFLFKEISPGMVRVKKEYRGPQNALLITSAAMDQVSTWYPEKKHSLFTYYFLKGLQGGADANSDKAITMGEMKAYLGDNVPDIARRLHNIEQQPMVNGNEKEVLVKIKN